MGKTIVKLIYFFFFAATLALGPFFPCVHSKLSILSSRLQISALTIGLSYFVGGLIPLIPYFFFDNTQIGLLWSSIVTILCLLIFGYAKSYYVAPENAGWNAIQTALVGAAAAGFAYAVIYAIGD